MDRLDFNKELYLKEIERKKSHNDALSVPIGVITGQVALLYFLSDNFEIIDKTFPLTWLSVLVYVNLAVIIISIWYLIISFYQPTIRQNPGRLESFFDYRYLDLPNQYEQFYQDTLNANTQNALQNPEQLANLELENVLIEDLTAATSHNTDLNDIKTERIAKAKLFLVLSIFISIFLVVFIFISSEKKEKEPQRIEIVEPVKITL